MRTDNKVVLYFGKFKGRTIGDTPTWYLGYLYASFSYFTRQLEPELRRRGVDGRTLASFRRRWRLLGKKPTASPGDSSLRQADQADGGVANT